MRPSVAMNALICEIAMLCSRCANLQVVGTNEPKRPLPPEQRQDRLGGWVAERDRGLAAQGLLEL
jgi:hypothetical protein